MGALSLVSDYRQTSPQQHVQSFLAIRSSQSQPQFKMASSVSVCKVGLNWDSPWAPRVYSQPKLASATNDYEHSKRTARAFNSSFTLRNSDIRISSFATNASTSTAKTATHLNVLDDSLNTRLSGRANSILLKMASSS